MGKCLDYHMMSKSQLRHKVVILVASLCCQPSNFCLQLPRELFFHNIGSVILLRQFSHSLFVFVFTICVRVLIINLIINIIGIALHLVR